MELEALRFIDRFGAQNVYGRPLGLGEMRRMRIAENIYEWAKAQNSGERAAWGQAHPEQSAALSYAFSCAKELGYHDGE